MKVIDIMTRKVVTVKRETPVLEALKIMRENRFRRLPVVDDEGRPVGIVTQDRLEGVKPGSTAPLLWQVSYVLSHTKVGDVMRKDLITVEPTDSVEYAVSKAQAAKVGTAIVVENGKVVGILTTTDFFYGIVNPTLGIGEPGTRIVVVGGGTGKAAEQIISHINKQGIEIKVMWGVFARSMQENNLILHLDTDEKRAAKLVEDFQKMGYRSRLVQRYTGNTEK